MIRNFEIMDLLGILKVDNYQSLGLVVLGKIYQPHTIISNIFK